MIYVFSDPHYGHKNICRGTSEWGNKNTRDFATLEKMNTSIVNNINSLVKEEDELWCLGDWNFGGIENLAIFRERVLCKNVGLILGNHDDRHQTEHDPVVKSSGRKASSYFSFYESYRQVRYKGTLLVLFHYPIASWNEMSSGSIHLFGHCHSPREARLFNGGKSMDVGLDGNDLLPYNLDNIMDIMKDRPIKKEGHHG